MRIILGVLLFILGGAALEVLECSASNMHCAVVGASYAAAGLMCVVGLVITLIGTLTEIFD